MKLLNRSIIAMGILGLALSVQAAKEKEKAPPSPAQPAIDKLLAEYQAVVEKKSENGLREKSDFFAKEKPSEITTDVILSVLEKPLVPDQRAECYVKWQLLSGISKFSESEKQRAIAAYRAAPIPPKHPGLDHAMLDKAVVRIGAKDVNNETPINKELFPVIEAYKDNVSVYLNYRDEFYSKFDPSYETFLAGFYDIYMRVSNGANAGDIWKGMTKTIRTWALASQEGNQMRTLAMNLEQLKTLVTDNKFRPYYRVMFLKEGSDPKMPGSLKWQSEGVIGDIKLMTEIGDWLKEHANAVPPGSTPAPSQPAPPKEPRNGKRYTKPAN